MNNRFDDIMRKHTDAELITIVNSPEGDYEPDALEAAKIELKKRNLSEVQITTATQEIEQKKQAKESRANAPLNFFWKVLGFIFPGIILFILAGTFQADGYTRKAKQLTRWTIYGFGFYFGLVLLLVIWETVFVKLT